MRVENLIVVFLWCILSLGTAHSQVYLQLETANRTKTIKFAPGDIIEFRTVAFPDTWRTGELGKVLFEAQTIFLDGNLFQLDEIKDLRLVGSSRMAKMLGINFIRFGATVALYTAIADLANINETKFTWNTVIISGAGVLLGTLLRFAVKGKKYKLGKRHRLRLIDHRFKLENELPLAIP